MTLRRRLHGSSVVAVRAMLAGTVLLLASAVSSETAAAQDPQRFSISQVRQLSSSPPSARAYLDVEDAGGQAVSELASTRLSASIGRSAAAMSSPRPFRSTEEGVAILFLVDISRSLRSSQFQDIVGAIEAWTERLRTRDRAALLSFGTASQLLVDWTDDFDEVRSALQSLGPTDDLTLLHQALADALELGDRNDAGLPNRRAIIVLSDGRDEGSQLALEDILASVRVSPTPIYTIGFVPPQRTDRSRDLDVLKRLAGNSGGSFFEATGTNLADAYVQIEHAIGEVWVTDVTCLDCAADGSDYRLQINLETQSRVLSMGTQLRLLPTVGVPAVGPKTPSASLPIEEATPTGRQPDRPPDRPPVGVRNQERAGVSSWLFSPRTLLFFWLPLLLGLSLLVAALLQSRSEKRRRGRDDGSRSSLESLMRSERSFGANQLYANREDEPDASPHATPAADSSSFSMSLPAVAGSAGADVALVDRPADRPADPPVDSPSEPSVVADSANQVVVTPLDFGFDGEPSPVPSLLQDEQGGDFFGGSLGESDSSLGATEPQSTPAQFGSGQLRADRLAEEREQQGAGSVRSHYALAPRVVRFVVLRGHNKGKQFRALLRETLVVGSRSTAGLVIAGEVNVCPEQFELAQDGSDILIRNLDESRPTLVNGHELEQRHVLKSGDLVGNGDVILRTIVGD